MDDLDYIKKHAGVLDEARVTKAQLEDLLARAVQVEREFKDIRNTLRQLATDSPQLQKKFNFGDAARGPYNSKVGYGPTNKYLNKLLNFTGDITPMMLVKILKGLTGK